jgi:hypothetical protein
VTLAALDIVEPCLVSQVQFHIIFVTSMQLASKTALPLLQFFHRVLSQEHKGDLKLATPLEERLLTVMYFSQIRYLSQLAQML